MAKPVSILETLPPEAKAQIITWLEVEPRRTVRDRIAKPPPEGFGISTRITTLNRFYAQHLAQERHANLEFAKSLAPDAEGEPVEAVAQTLARDWALEIAMKPRRNLESFRALSRWLLHLRELSQKDRELTIQSDCLAFDRERYKFDITNAIIEHLPSLNEIVNEDKSEHEDKINRARSLIFKRPISELPPRILPGHTDQQSATKQNKPHETAKQ